jgi:hypothetical protein
MNTNHKSIIVAISLLFGLIGFQFQPRRVIWIRLSAVPE